MQRIPGTLVRQGLAPAVGQKIDGIGQTLHRKDFQAFHNGASAALASNTKSTSLPASRAEGHWKLDETSTSTRTTLSINTKYGQCTTQANINNLTALRLRNYGMDK
jgi:hypothetical protein